ncbi:hypothetical protein B0J12DRAFT_702703 [Macrophomina phaseolina]|uniref:Uncharacterized protein n=1 Tax=Macrophomina phaseolina TaxID=35725 RepID=A0ABQ8G0H0_9PEZI|nr:hypothetical protein B0J12DRAFT_702703 [Macrophomina phaseolina]
MEDERESGLSDSLLSKNEFAQDHLRKRKTRCYYLLYYVLRYLFYTLWIYLIALTAFYTANASKQNVQKPGIRLGSLAEDESETVPFFDRIHVTFTNHSEYSLFGAKQDADVGLINKRWDELIPRGRGFIRVPKARQNALPTPMLDRRKGLPYWGITVFHQIHCLHIVYSDFVRLWRNGSAEHPEDHLEHCFEYLRLAIMCYSDTTLEGKDPFTERLQGTIGIGATH